MIYYSVDNEIRDNVTNKILIISIIFSFSLSVVLDLININRILSVLIGYLPLLSIYNYLFKKFDESWWRHPFINKIINIPDLNGVWEGRLRSSFKCKDPDNCTCEYKDSCSPSLKGIKRIQQTFSKISIISYNGMSKSATSSIAGFLIDNSKYGENPMLLYKHENMVDNLEADVGMKSHSGFNELIYDRKTQELSGKYYNDENRGTFGKVLYIKVL